MSGPNDPSHGRRQYFTPSGLVVLFDKPLQPVAGEGWARSPSDLSFPTGPGPSLLDQMVVVFDEEALGLPPATVEEVREQVSSLPWAQAAVLAARIATLLWPIRDDSEAQFGLARSVFGDAAIMNDFRRFLDSDLGAHRYLFHEQQLFVLLRLILEHGKSSDASTPWTEEDALNFRKALVEVTSVVALGSKKVRESARSSVDWLGFLTQNSAYNASEDALLTYQRNWRIFKELATDAEAQAHDAYCDLAAWHQKHLGITLEELLAVGHSAAYRAESAPGPMEQRAIVPPMQTYLAPTKLANRHEKFTEALSAPRPFYVDGFEASRGNELRLAWETTPFMSKPFLQLPDGVLCLTSPRALQGFLTDGIYYRFLDIAANEGARDDYTKFVGWLVERYVVELFKEGLGSRPAGDGRVLGEQPYAGKQLTSDVAVDYGVDLVLVEVVSTRLPLGVRAEADEAVLAQYLKRSITNKLKQLNRVIDDLLSQRARLPDVDANALQRIWPVLVTYGDFVPADPLFAYIANETQGMFDQAPTRPLTLMGIQDVEMLMGLLAGGENLIDVLSKNGTGAYATLSFARWLTDTYDPLPPRPAWLEQRWRDSTDQQAKALDPAYDKS